MIAFIAGTTLTFLSAFISAAMNKDPALQPSNQSYARALDILSSLAAIIGLPAFVYSFWVFDWWVPLITFVLANAIMVAVRLRFMMIAPALTLICSTIGPCLVAAGLSQTG